MKNRRACLWRFTGILLDGSRIELTGLPFISADEDKIRKEAIRRSIEYDRAAPENWVMDCEMEAVKREFDEDSYNWIV